jgi:hypothetical protein
LRIGNSPIPLPAATSLSVKLILGSQYAVFLNA